MKMHKDNLKTQVITGIADKILSLPLSAIRRPIALKVRGSVHLSRGTQLTVQALSINHNFGHAIACRQGRLSLPLHLPEFWYSPAKA
jgi:hypothetical protein